MSNTCQGKNAEQEPGISLISHSLGTSLSKLVRRYKAPTAFAARYLGCQDFTSEARFKHGAIPTSNTLVIIVGHSWFTLVHESV